MNSGFDKVAVHGDAPCQPTYYSHRQAQQVDVLRTSACMARCVPTQSCRKIGFMTLPIEIRLSIYEYVHASNKMILTNLAAGYPAPAITEYHVRPVNVDVTGTNAAAATEKTDGASSERKPVKMLSPHRPSGKIPTALLLTNRDIYLEARVIPFHHGEFVFLNWWSSGLWSASVTTDKMTKWQLEETRYVRVEVRLDDFDGHDSIERWVKQCERWKDGLRGMRLKITSPCLPLDRRLVRDTYAGLMALTDGKSRGGLDEWAWAQQGLVLLRRLERLEVELDVPGSTALVKLAWCQELQMLVGKEMGMGMEVVCVERMDHDPRLAA